MMTAVAAAALAVVGVSACSTKVGAAAFVDGQRISETEVAHYFTATAEPAQTQDSSGNVVSTAPRAFVLSAIINIKIYDEVLATPPARKPTAGQISAAEAQSLGTTTLAAAEASYVQHGYEAKVVPLLLQEQALQTIIQNQVSAGVDVQAIVKKLPFKVTVNPRYGTWDKANLELNTSATAGLPSFLTITKGTATTPAATPSPAG